MGTVNGFGVTYYGWKRLDDDTAEATAWIVAAFFPVAPVRRSRLRVVTSSGARASFFVVGGSGFHIQSQEIERLPLDRKAILKTYLKGLIVVPLLLLLPLFLLAGAGSLYRHMGGPNAAAGFPAWIPLCAIVVIIAYWAVLVATLDRSAGRHLFAARAKR